MPMLVLAPSPHALAFLLFLECVPFEPPLCGQPFPLALFCVSVDLACRAGAPTYKILALSCLAPFCVSPHTQTFMTEPLCLGLPYPFVAPLIPFGSGLPLWFAVGPLPPRCGISPFLSWTTHTHSSLWRQTDRLGHFVPIYLPLLWILLAVLDSFLPTVCPCYLFACCLCPFTHMLPSPLPSPLCLCVVDRALALAPTCILWDL